MDEGRQFNHALFIQHLLEEQQTSLLTCETARSIWVSIENQYQQNSIERRQALHQQFLNVTYDTDHSVRAHIEKIKLLAKELTDAGCPTDELSIINRILTTLPDPFLGFFTGLVGKHSYIREKPGKPHDKTMQ